MSGSERREAGSESSRSITLHSSWFGIIAASLGAVGLFAVAIGVLAIAGVGWVSVVVALVAIALGAVVLFDMPIATTFDVDGVERRTPLRRHRISWDDIAGLQRMPRGGIRRATSQRAGGIVARRGGRQILLVDRMEGRREHAELREIVDTDTLETVFGGLDSPPPNRTPTWVRRSKRWKPDEGESGR
ncbi:hypothetical protein [Ilumatobacter nonamiensis]|uniref:hypothetical protein n=1 Tax=Ilumatobacter nonamiensis TaxID=467093 RepID=UPI00034AEC29|nr:hypothetical protein [Ilumatobacter nonamiensis]